MSFINRFSTKKKQDNPTASRNFNSVGPVKANSNAVQQNNARIHTSKNGRDIKNSSEINLYQISGDPPNETQVKRAAVREKHLMEDKKALREQVQNLETTLQINKDIIKNLLDSQQQQNPNQTLQNVLTSQQQENLQLQSQLKKAYEQRDEALQQLRHQELDQGSQREKEKEKQGQTEKQLADLKELLMQRESALLTMEQTMNQVMQLAMKRVGHDEDFFSKIMELKKKALEGKASSSDQQDHLQQSMVSENIKLKKELEFAEKELVRLRAKLVVDEEDMPTLTEQLLQGQNGAAGGMFESFQLQREELSAGRLQAVIGEPSHNRTVAGSRNEGPRQVSTGGSVPRLDFKKLKHVQEYQDWYKYALKLEDSVKFLRVRIKQLEDDNFQANLKFRKELAQKEKLFQLNDKLNRALKRANVKIAEVKEKYKQKVSQKCYYCNNEIDFQMDQFLTSLDPINITSGGFNKSFNLDAEGRGSFKVPGGLDKSFNQKDREMGGMEDDDDIDILPPSSDLDKVMVEESNPQTESDKNRGMSYYSFSKEKGGRGVDKLAQIQDDSLVHTQEDKKPMVVQPQQQQQQQKIIVKQQHIVRKQQQLNKYHRANPPPGENE